MPRESCTIYGLDNWGWIGESHAVISSTATAGAAMMPWQLLAEAKIPEKSGDYYPPAPTGLRGSHPGSFETAHGLRDGTFWRSAEKPEDTGETYDLIIVGGGISGLSAAYFFRKQVGRTTRILILDNHDDFGDHAKRNEFRAGKRTLIGYGGTYSIETPEPYSEVASTLVRELGIGQSLAARLRL